MADRRDKTALKGSVEIGSIVGVAELADLFKVGRTTVSNWDERRERNGFPKRLKTLASGPIYDVNEVVRWFIDYEPDRGGRPGRIPVLKSDGSFTPA